MFAYYRHPDADLPVSRASSLQYTGTDMYSFLRSSYERCVDRDRVYRAARLVHATRRPYYTNDY